MLVVLVGLPATGKTLLAKKLANYLNWIGHKAKGECRFRNASAPHCGKRKNLARKTQNISPKLNSSFEMLACSFFKTSVNYDSFVRGTLFDECGSSRMIGAVIALSR